MKLNFKSSVFYTAEYQQDIAIKFCTCNYSNGYVFLQDVCIHSNSSIENSFHSIELECKEIFLYSSLSRHLIFNFRYASQLAISLYQAKSRVFVKKYLAFESQSQFKKKILE